MTRPGIEPRSPGPLANTLPTRPMWDHMLGVLASVYGVKYLVEIYKQVCCLKIFCKYSFNDLTNSHKLRSYWLISPKAVQIFPVNFLDFWSHTTEKQDIINLNSYSSKSYAFVEFWWFQGRISFGKGRRSLSSISPVCFANRQRCIIEEVCRQISLSYIFQEVFRRGQLFGFYFFQYRIKFFLRKLSEFDVFWLLLTFL